MAKYNTRHGPNVHGRFFVDEKCVGCDLCSVIASENFSRCDNKSQSYVFKQPSTPTELKQCLEALTKCPVNAIRYLEIK